MILHGGHLGEAKVARGGGSAVVHVQQQRAPARVRPVTCDGRRQRSWSNVRAAVPEHAALPLPRAARGRHPPTTARHDRYVNGYDHPHIIAGAGTLGVEILEQVCAWWCK